MKIPLWTAAEIADATAGRMLNVDADTPITGVQFDSRLIEKGDVFLALKGDGADGHAYIHKAFAAGAVCAVVDYVPGGEDAAPLIEVQDTQRALEALGIAARNRCAAKRIAITGSVGKTSTKEMMAHVFAQFGKTHAAKASFNNHIGVPLTLARMPQDSAFGIFEIGMNHSGEIMPLTGFVQPDVAIITAVEPVHIENFPNIQAIAHAKAEIFSALAPNGVAIINADSQELEIVLAAARAKAARVLTYSARVDQNADAYIRHIELMPECSVVSAQILGMEVVYKIGAPGAHFALNSLAVLLTAVVLQQDLALAALALAEVTPPKGRGARVQLKTEQGEVLLLDESYNANPASMRAALDVLRTTPVQRQGRRIVVLGQMLELGDFSHHAHVALQEPIEAAHADLVFCSGAAMKPLWDILPGRIKGAYADTAAGLEVQLFSTLRDGDVVLLKGSNGSGIWRIVESLKTRFAQ